MRYSGGDLPAAPQTVALTIVGVWGSGDREGLVGFGMYKAERWKEVVTL